MSWLLDSNACIRYLNGRSTELRARIDAADPAQLVVCSVVKGELFYGAARSNDPVKTLDRQRVFFSRFASLPYDDAAAEVYGRVRAQLFSAGTPIGPNDLMIAAIALANGVTLVTDNIQEFSRVAGLTVENWQAPLP
jgi:tRNA(fMet)-specific endonuclease VapC